MRADRSDRPRLPRAGRPTHERDVAPETAAQRRGLRAVQQSVVDHLGSAGCGHIAKKTIAGRVRPVTALLDPSDESAQRQHHVSPQHGAGNMIAEVHRDAHRHVQPLNGDNHSPRRRQLLDNQLARRVGRDADRRRGAKDVPVSVSEPAHLPARLQRDYRRRDRSFRGLDLGTQRRSKLGAHALQRGLRLPSPKRRTGESEARGVQKLDRHAAAVMWYSWMSPPSRSRRLTRRRCGFDFARTPGRALESGGLRSRARCGRCSL
jgi:hypothetical protein